MWARALGVWALGGAVHLLVLALVPFAILFIVQDPALTFQRDQTVVLYRA